MNSISNLNVKFVYKLLSPQEKEGVLKLWMDAGVVSYSEAIQRVEQVSTLILFKNEIVGVSTVYLNSLENEKYFFFRMFIKSEYRGSNTLRTQVMRLNFQELKTRYENQIKGLAVELENTKLAKLAQETQYMSKRGYTFFGKSTRELQLWYVMFDEPKGIFIY